MNIDTLPIDIRLAEPDVLDLLPTLSLEEVELLHIKKILSYTNGNKSEAARILKIGIATLYRKLEEYKL